MTPRKTCPKCRSNDTHFEAEEKFAEEQAGFIFCNYCGRSTVVGSRT